jgi:hypothetical protein
LAENEYYVQHYHTFLAIRKARIMVSYISVYVCPLVITLKSVDLRDTFMENKLHMCENEKCTKNFGLEISREEITWINVKTGVDEWDSNVAV